MSLLVKATIAFCVAFVSGWLTSSAILYHRIMSSTYTTPWYDARWWKNPYLTFRLSGQPTVERWSRTADGNPALIREVTVGDKTFWTIIAR